MGQQNNYVFAPSLYNFGIRNKSPFTWCLSFINKMSANKNCAHNIWQLYPFILCTVTARLLFLHTQRVEITQNTSLIERKKILFSLLQWESRKRAMTYYRHKSLDLGKRNRKELIGITSSQRKQKTSKLLTFSALMLNNNGVE